MSVDRWLKKKQNKQMVRRQRRYCVTTHSLVSSISSAAVSHLPQTRLDADLMSLVLITVQHPHFRESDWSCASRKSLLIRRPPDARLMNESVCEPTFKLQAAEQSLAGVCLWNVCSLVLPAELIPITETYCVCLENEIYCASVFKL